MHIKDLHTGKVRGILKSYGFWECDSTLSPVWNLLPRLTAAEVTGQPPACLY